MALDETVLLHFDIDESGAVDSINELRAANKFLTQERNKVNIATKEGQAELKKINELIDKNNKLIKDNSSALEKQRQNVGNYSKSIEEAAGNLNVMGTNVGGLATKLSSFNNPATAAVAVVSALGAAYASSTIGARDLTFAQNQLAAATGIVTNEFAALFSSAEDGEGAITGLLNNLLNALGPAGVALGQQSKAIALAKEQIEDLNRNEIIARAEIQGRLEENVEILEKIADSQTDYNEKIDLASKAIINLSRNEDQILAIKKQQLAAIDRQLSGDATNEKLLDERALKELEIAAIQRDTQKRISQIEKSTSNLNDLEKKRLQTLKEQNFVRGKGPEEFKAGTLKNVTGSLAGDAATREIKLSDDVRKAVVENNQEKGESAEEYTNRVLALQQQEAGAARDLAGTLAGIAEEGTELQKALAITTIAINSGIGVSEAVKAGAGIPFPANLSAILSGITAVLAGIAQAKNLLGFAEGGWTGPGSKYKAVGIVHADEYVAPKHIVNSPAAKPHIQALESMRVKGYADGGFVANTNIQPSQQAMIMANAMKNLPPIYTSWTEGRTVGRRVEFKEKVTRQ